MMSQYSVDTDLDVVVTGRIVEESLCEGTCAFRYVDTGASIVDVPANATYKEGDVVTITGTGLTGATVTVKGVDCVATANDTSVTFTYPALPAGNYQIFIKVANGWTYPQIMSSTLLSLVSADVAGGSFAGM